MQQNLFNDIPPGQRYAFMPSKMNDSPPSPNTSIAIKEKSPIQYILDVQKFRTIQDMLRLRVAVLDAENIKNYNRYLLHLIYRDIMLDPNLDSQWGSRKMKTKEKAFKIVGADGITEDKEATRIFDEMPWFIDFMDAALDSRAWGFSMIEFGPMLSTGEFLPYQVNGKIYPAVNVLDRDNVKPELGLITDTPGNSYGISMADPSFADSLMFIGNFRTQPPHSYGFYYKCAKYILFKDNCLGNWSEWAEIYGMPMRIGKTAAEGAQRERFIRAIRDLGSNSYGVFSPTDSIELVSQNRNDAYQVYERLIRYIDEQISKIVFGQDVVTNNTGRVVGEVGENVANMYGSADAKFLYSVINSQLIPKMVKLGCSKLAGKKFKWDSTEKLTLEQRINIDSSLAKMGFRPTKDYLEQTYGTSLEDPRNDMKDENKF